MFATDTTLDIYYQIHKLLLLLTIFYSIIYSGRKEPKDLIKESYDRNQIEDFLYSYGIHLRAKIPIKVLYFMVGLFRCFKRIFTQKVLLYNEYQLYTYSYIFTFYPII